jgi:DNA-binding NarL/FixJ family response regulator
MRVLLVDDDEGFRETLRRLLMQPGRPVQVEEAADGEEALRVVANRQPDVVLMDLTMPRMNGVEATRRLKTRWPDLPVIVLTVHDEPVYERTARAAGADGFVLKKTAGTALWPALVPFASRSRSAGPGPVMGVARALVSLARQAIDRARSREHTRRVFREGPDWQALPSPL